MRCPNWCKYRCRCCRRCKCSWTKAGLWMNTMSLLTSIATIIFFAVKLGQLGKYNYIYEYKLTICYPTSGYALDVTCSDRKNHGWISILNDKGNRSIVNNPFAIENTRAQAIENRYRVLGNNYTCMCRPPNSPNWGKIKILACSIWPDCIIDIGFVKYTQHDNQRWIRTYVAFIASSVVSIIFAVAAYPISIRTLRRENRADEGFVQL